MKTNIGKYGIIPAMPVTLIATEYGGKINFAPHGQCGTVTAEPQVIYTSVVKEHLTAQNILKTGRFSVNIPTVNMLEKVKNCGKVSGSDADKSSEFEVFYGSEKTPMIKDCPVSFVCKVIEKLELNGFYMFLGEVIETYADDDCLTDGMPDVSKVMPLLCSIDGSFRTVGDRQ
jgi:flavin reductase (DIM6/NTAB) family NADH-FMN oxidoreductase RutF